MFNGNVYSCTYLHLLSYNCCSLRVLKLWNARMSAFQVHLGIQLKSLCIFHIHWLSEPIAHFYLFRLREHKYSPTIHNQFQQLKCLKMLYSMQYFDDWWYLELLIWIDLHYLSTFAASMRNHITWETIDAEQFLDVDVKLNLVLEVIIQLKFILSELSIPSSFLENVVSLECNWRVRKH